MVCPVCEGVNNEVQWYSCRQRCGIYNTEANHREVHTVCARYELARQGPPGTGPTGSSSRLPGSSRRRSPSRSRRESQGEFRSPSIDSEMERAIRGLQTPSHSSGAGSHGRAPSRTRFPSSAIDPRMSSATSHRRSRSEAPVGE